MDEYRDKNGPDQNALYELYGIVMHHGSTISSGHYTAYIKINDKWYYCSDSHCHETALNEIETLSESTKSNDYSSPYILFYKQKSFQPIVYKQIDRARAEENIEDAIKALPLQLEAEIESLKSTIKSNTNLLATNAKNLKTYSTPDKRYQASNRYEYYQEENKAYAIAIYKIEQILKIGNFEPYFNQYIAHQKIIRENVIRSMEIQLIETNYLLSQISNFIADYAKNEARKELYTADPSTLNLAQSRISLEKLNSSLNSLSFRKIQLGS